MVGKEVQTLGKRRLERGSDAFVLAQVLSEVPQPIRLITADTGLCGLRVVRAASYLRRYWGVPVFRVAILEQTAELEFGEPALVLAPGGMDILVRTLAEV